MTEEFNETTDYGDLYEQGDYGDYQGAQVTPELVQAVASELAAQQGFQQAPSEPAFDPVAQAHADHILEAVPALQDPNSPEFGRFTQIVRERAEATGVPELATDLRFARSVFDSLPEGGLKSAQERTADAIFAKRGNAVLPWS